MMGRRMLSSDLNDDDDDIHAELEAARLARLTSHALSSPLTPSGHRMAAVSAASAMV